MSDAMLVPNLRFPEFEGGWDERTLGSFISTHKGGASLKPSDFVETKGYEVIPKKGVAKGGKLRLDLEAPTYCSKNAYVSFKNSVINDSYIVTTLRDLVPSAPSIGYIVKIDSGKSYLMAQGVYALKVNSKKGVEAFLTQFSNSDKYRKWMFRIKVGSTQVHIRMDDFKKTKVFSPSLSEQQKIADFLTAVDKRIEQLEDKKRLLTEYKKGVMQQIFSQQIRFKDDKVNGEAREDALGYNPPGEPLLPNGNSPSGNPYPDWEENLLGGMCKITTGKLDANAQVEGGKYRFYTCAKDYFRIDKYQFDTEALLISGNGANVGYIHYYKGKFNAYQRTYVLDGFSEDIIFIKYVLEKDLRKRIYSEKNEGSMPYIILGTLSGMNIYMPSDKGEQRKIAGFFIAIDNKIEQIGAQLEQAKTFKKGLLQQMFV